jgi:hypothetical protein
MSVHLEKCAASQCGYVFLIERSSASAGDGIGSGFVECPLCRTRVAGDPGMTYITRCLSNDIGDWPEEGAWT